MFPVYIWQNNNADDQSLLHLSPSCHPYKIQCVIVSQISIWFGTSWYIYVRSMYGKRLYFILWKSLHVYDIIRFVHNVMESHHIMSFCFVDFTGSNDSGLNRLEMPGTNMHTYEG